MELKIVKQYYRKAIYGWCFAALLLISNNLVSAEFVGAKVCNECHQSQYQDWLGSDHAKSMAIADQNSVAADFSDVSVEFHQIKSRFYIADGKYWVSTIDSSGQSKTFQIIYTFGHYPLQQYLVETDKGHIQALNLAWNNLPKEEGGQHWYHLQSEEVISPEHPFFWTRHFQNWNSRCADCHSTNLDKNYDPVAKSYQTQWSEINVACEACHGPASDHVLLAREGKISSANSGFKSHLPRRSHWQFQANSEIATRADLIAKKNVNDTRKLLLSSQENQINTCGGCHSRRSPLDKTRHGAAFHEQFQLQTLDEGLYFPDGQIQDEVFVMGSFLQSKMFQQGVTCNDCHNAHSGKLHYEGNEVCLQCHAAPTYNSPAHHQHPLNDSTPQCVDCHMPETVYMGVDARRDHSFVIPDLKRTHAYDVPNACQNCHEDSQKLILQSGQRKATNRQVELAHLTEVNQQLRRMNPLSVVQVKRLFDENNLFPIQQATLLGLLANSPSRVSVELAAQGLKNSNPLVRQNAVSAMESVPREIRLQQLLPVLNDPVRAVRHEVTRLLVGDFWQLPENVRKMLESPLEEYRDALTYNIDSPAGLLAMANLEIALQNYAAAESRLLDAIDIEPSFVPAIINLADLYRAQNKEALVGQWLNKAVEIAPDSGMAQHALGLHWVRLKTYEKALLHLALATKQSDSQPRYVFVYAVALDNLGRTEEAIALLKRAVNTWPNQYDLLATLVSYYEKIGRIAEAGEYISQLSRLAPNSPQVKRLVEQFKSS